MSCIIPANPDVSGIGVRIAIYIQNFLCFVPAVWAIWDGHVSDYELESAETHSTTNLVLAFAILISCIFQAIARGLTNYHASIVLGLSWMNNTNAFVYFLLYVQHKSQGGSGSVEPTLSSWATHVKKQSLTILCIPEGLTRSPSISKREPGTIVAKNAAGVIFKRIALFLGSLHLTLMAALGIWLWSSPQSFGAIESAICATQVADLAVLGVRVRFGSQVLRIVSLTIYSLLLVPGINLLLPMSLFLGFHCWYHSRRSTQPTLPQHNSNVQPSTLPIDVRLKRVLPVCVGLGFLLAVNIAFLTDVELTLRRNGGVQESGESDWGFGQILAILLVFMPLRDLTEAIIRRRQELRTKLNEALKKAIDDKDANEVARWVSAGADPNVKADSGLTALQTVVRLGNYGTTLLLLDRGAEVNAPFSDGSTALQTAVRLGNSDTISLLVDRGADMNAPFNDASTALQAALCLGNSDTISLLVDRGADVNVQFSDGKTALEVVYLSKRWSVLRDIIRAGAALNKPFKGGQTLLELVCINEQWDLAKDVVTAGTDVNIETCDGQTLLEVAILAEETQESTSFIRLVIKAGADVNKEFSGRTTALEAASLASNWDLVRTLVAAGASVNKDFSDGRTALEVAAMAFQWDIVRILVAAGASVNEEFKASRQTSLEIAIRAKESEESISLIRDVLKAGADAERLFSDRTTALEAASLASKWDFVRTLVAAGVRVNRKFSDGRTALQVAALASQWDIVRILVAAGAGVNEEFKASRQTSLEVAVRAEESGENISLIQDIVKAGADVNKQFPDGWTALEVATLENKWDFVRILLMAGADVNKEFRNTDNIYRKTCLHAACFAGREDIVTLLVQHNANPNSQPGRLTPLYCASEGGHVKCIKALLDGGADVNIQDCTGDTGLHGAGYYHHVDCVKVLLEHGADASIRNKRGETALQEAKVNSRGGGRFSEISDLFRSYGVVE